MNNIYAIWQNLEPHHPVLIFLAIAIVIFVTLPILMMIRKSNAPYKRNPIVDFIELKLVEDPLNAKLLLAAAEVCLRQGRPVECIANLERAFEVGTPIDELEPTFWAFFAAVGVVERANADFWYDFYKKQAPRLFPLLVPDKKEGLKLALQRVQQGTISVTDRETRNKIYLEVTVAAEAANPSLLLQVERTS